MSTVWTMPTGKLRRPGMPYLLLGAVWLGACGEVEPPLPEMAFEERLQQQLIQARPGDVVEIPAGVHQITRSLSLTVPGVTIRGAGMDVSILSFRNQAQGAEGILVSADDFVIEDLAIEDTAGDALKINQSNRVTVRRVRTEWTNGPAETNGAYGIYPVQSTDVLIEGSVAIAASDAGIYVGQSRNIIVRNSRAEYNVAGIEIENSTFADVYDNVATNNTGGILVFDLPDLPVQGGRNTRVFNNRVVANNTPNFAPEGNIVGTVPTGTGVMVLANDNIEIFGNEIGGNATANVLVVSYFITELPIEDPDYDPFPELIHLHDNRFSAGGSSPDSEPLQALAGATGQAIPDLVWDGILRDGSGASDALCLSGAGEPGFVNLDAPNGFAAPSFDPAAHRCSLPPLITVELGAGGN